MTRKGSNLTKSENVSHKSLPPVYSPVFLLELPQGQFAYP